MLSSSYNTAFCDWLDVTQSPDNSSVHEVRSFLLGLLWSCGADGNFRPDTGGVAKLDEKARFHRLSFSGDALGWLRDHGKYTELLTILGAVPHTITRLDIALDRPENGPEVVGHLRATHRDGVRLSRKVTKCSSLLSLDSDGAETGTVYFGHRSNARVTARVYDKAHEVLEKKGIKLPPTVRYELTVRKDVGATLRDAVLPTALFWKFMRAILEPPPDVPEWESESCMEWEFEGPSELPAARLRRRVQQSAEISALIELADQIGPYGREFLMRQLQRRVQPENASIVEGWGNENV